MNEDNIDDILEEADIKRCEKFTPQVVDLKKKVLLFLQHQFKQNLHAIDDQATLYLLMATTLSVALSDIFIEHYSKEDRVELAENAGRIIATKVQRSLTS